MKIKKIPKTPILKNHFSFPTKKFIQKRNLIISYKEMLKTNSHGQAQTEINEYFFGPLPQYDSAPINGIPSNWYKTDLRNDAFIKNVFGEYIWNAVNGRLDNWQKTPIGKIFLIK